MSGLMFCLSLAAASSSLAGTNLYPDPSFEQTGETGVARTGQRAGHLKVAGQQHWAALGGKLTVEPFATYRATAFVRAKPGQGTLYGLYVYSWNSFDWRWARNVPLADTPDWKQLEITFVSPNDYVEFHPLAAIDAANAEAWVDDVVVEKVLSAKETMKELLAKPPQDEQDVELRARYHVSRSELDKAWELAAASSDYVKADVTCLMAKSTKDRARRLELAAELVRYGGLSCHNGELRLNELLADATPDERVGVLRKAIEVSGFGVAATRAYVATISRQLDDASRLGSCRQCDEQINQIEAQVSALLQQCPENAPGRKEIESVKAKVSAAREAVAKRKAELGNCVIRIGGKPLDPATHAIVVPEQPTPQEDFAAKDLNAHIEKLTGKDLPIVADGKLEKQTPIVVGNCPKTLRKLRVRPDLKGLGAEGIVIRTKGPALVLAGGTRGVLYAVYSFLEDYCGCRWFTPDCTVLPKTGTFEIGELNVRHTPPLEYRSTDYPCSRPADWAVRNKMNGTQTQLDDGRGGKIDYSHFVHTFNSILDPGQHFATHPEYFSEIKGKRQGGNTQLCLTNPEVIEIAKKTVRKWIQEAPSATIFSVSQNDWANYCECPKCKALDDAEGSHAATMIAFVNAIARDIAKDHPDKVIDTLAYQYTRTPPKTIRPEPNVCVRLCTIECDFAHALDKSTHPQNQKFVKDIQGWNKLSNRLYIWDYIIDYGHSVMPWPNLYALAPNIRFFIANGVKGLYEEACYFTKGSELPELRTWIIAKTMWDPKYDTDKAIDEFLAAYYGPAAPHIRAYINLMHKPVLDDPSMHIFIWTAPNAPYLNDKAIAEAARLFDEAEKAVASDPMLLHRVQVARLPVLYVQIVNSKQGFKEEGDTLVDTATGDEAELLKRFETIARKEGLTTVREHHGTGALDAWLKSVSFAGKKLPIVRLSNDALDLAILPSLGGRIWKMVHKPTGREIIKRYKDREGNEIPDAGGYEEYSEGQYRSPGWNEPYRVVKRDKGSVTLEAKLKSGLKLTRVITLDPTAPAVTIDSTLTNADKVPRQACLRIHPGYAVPDVRKAVVQLRRPDGKWETRDLAKDDKDEVDEWLQGDAVPDGQWMVVDTATGFGIRSSFDKTQVSQCLLNRSRKDGRVNLELYSKSAQLEPGKSLQLKQTIEVVPNTSAPAQK